MYLGKEVKNRNFFTATSEKSIQDFIENVKENASRFGFGVRELFDMSQIYEDNSVSVSDDFEVYSIMICNFEKSYKSTRKNPERAAILLEPKQIVVYKNNGATTINYLPFSKEFIQQALPEDKRFSGSLYESCQKIIRLIEASK